MTSHAQPEVFRPIDDRIYQLSSQPLAVDKDTVHRTSSYVNAQANGLGTLASPLNTGQQTTFVVNNSSGAKLRWGTMGLAIEMVFHRLTQTAVDVPVIGDNTAVTYKQIHEQPCNAPSWNMTGALIRQVTMKIGGVEIYKSTNGLFCEEFTARLLRNYDYDALNHRDDMLFTPVGAHNYCVGSAENLVAEGTPAAVDVRKTVLPGNLPHMSTGFISITPTGAAPGVTTVTFAGYNPVTNTFAQDPLLRERAVRWCSGETHHRVVTKVIPFLDLIPRISDSVMRNLRQFELSIVWENTTDLLEHTSITGDVDHSATHGAVSVTQCYIITDAYAMSPVQAQEVVTEKVGGETDQFMMYSTMATTRPYSSGSDIVIPNIRHLDSVMILQRARGFMNVATLDGTRRTYQSHGEFLMFGNSNNAASAAKLRADAPAASGTAEPIASVQIAYSGTDYPSSPIDIGRAVVAGTVCADFTRLYMEYLKGIARVGRRDVSAAVPYAMFKTTMPFIYLRPFADDAPKLSAEGRDLTIRVRGGSANALPANNMCIVIFQLKAFSITPDGVCREIS